MKRYLVDDIYRRHITNPMFGQDLTAKQISEQIINGQWGKITKEFRETPFGYELWKRMIYYMVYTKPKYIQNEDFRLDMLCHFNPVERYDRNGPYEVAIKDFSINGIHEKFGLSFTEWLQLPFFLAEEIVQRCIFEREELKKMTPPLK